jgi:hypothetical protein
MSDSYCAVSPLHRPAALRPWQQVTALSLVTFAFPSGHLLRSVRSIFRIRLWERDFFLLKTSRLAPGPTQPPVKRPGREANNSPSSSIEVTADCSCMSAPHLCFQGLDRALSITSTPIPPQSTSASLELFVSLLLSKTVANSKLMKGIV